MQRKPCRTRALASTHTFLYINKVHVDSSVKDEPLDAGLLFFHLAAACASAACPAQYSPREP